MSRTSSLVSLLALVYAASALLPAHARAQACDPPRVLLTLDRSSSMRGLLSDGTTKWSAAVGAIAEIASTHEGRLELGLQLGSGW